jgi:hypothetical protein
MRSEEGFLPLPVLLTLANEQLSANGYRVVRDLSLSGLPSERALLAEDEYGVVAIVAYETWAQLATEWSEAQAELVGLLGRRLARSAPKAWDGYLVLLCTGFAPDAAAVSQIERDTTRIRKFVATAEMLKTTSDLTRILDIFMPLVVPESTVALTDVLDALPDLMGEQVDRSAVRTVIDAFRTMEPPLERLHALGEGR